MNLEIRYKPLSTGPQVAFALRIGLLRSPDPALHALTRTTNLLERFFREFRNKADEIGAFPNQTSCLILFFLVMQREHAKHDRLYLANNS